MSFQGLKKSYFKNSHLAKASLSLRYVALRMLNDTNNAISKMLSEIRPSVQLL